MGLPLLPADLRASRGPANVGIVASEFSGIVPNGGVGTFYTALARELAAAGHTVTLLYTQGVRSHSAVGDFEYWRKWYEGFNIKLVPVHHVPRYGSSYHASVSHEAYLRLRALHAEAPFDVVHFPDWQGHGYYALLAKHLGRDFAGATLCVMVHGPLRWARLGNAETLYDPSDLEVDFLERQTIRLADILLSPSAYLIRWIKGQGWSVPEGAVHIQPYLTPDVKPPRDGEGGEGGGHGGAAPGGAGPIDEIVFFGRWEARKGIQTFCDAVRGLVADMVGGEGGGEPARGFKVTFMGSDRGTIGAVSSRDFVGKCISEWEGERVAGRAFPVTEVALESSLNSFQAHTYLQKANCIAVLPSLFENSPLSIFELISMGVPFIASDAGGIPELVHPESKGRAIFAAASADQLKSKLRGALRSPSEQLRVRGMYDPASVLEQWLQWHQGKAGAGSLGLGGGDGGGGDGGGGDGGGVEGHDGQCTDEDLAASEAEARAATLSSPGAGLSLCLIAEGGEEETRATLKSLIGQQLEGCEILLWGDATKASEAFLRENGHARIQRLRSEGGLGTNRAAEMRNGCAEHATGTHLLFVQSGEVLMQNAVSELWSAAVGRGVDITTSFMALYQVRAPHVLETVDLTRDAFHVQAHGMKVFPFVYLGGGVLPGLYQNVYGGGVLLVSKAVFGEIGPFDSILSDGYSAWEFYCRAAASGLSMEVVPKGLFLSPAREGYTRQRGDQPKARRAVRHFLDRLPEAVQRDVLSMKPESIPHIAGLA